MNNSFLFRLCTVIAVVGMTSGMVSAAPQEWQTAVRRMCETGRQGAADSVFQKHYVYGAFDPSLLLQWVEVKAVLEQYPQAARLLCEGMRREPHYTLLMQSQMARLLADADSTAALAALDAFCDCALAPPGGDSAGIGRWLPQMYGRYNLFARERTVLMSLAAKVPDLDRRLMDMAQMHLISRRYNEAVESARLLCRPGIRADAAMFGATVMFQAFDRLGMRDSAVYWIDRARVSGPSARIFAAVLYQQAGLAAKADSTIALLPQGVARDTLQMRQLLFTRNADSALSIASAMAKKPWWQADRRVLQIFQARAALFAGNAGVFTAVLDSIAAPPSWEYAKELVEYRYRMRVLGHHDQAFSTWGAVESALFRGALTEAAVMPASLPVAASRSLRMRVMRRLLLQGEIGLASTLAAGLDSADAPAEQVYYCAEILIRQGSVDPGRRMLEQLILRDPRDVFSSRARIVLEKLKP